MLLKFGKIMLEQFGLSNIVQRLVLAGLLHRLLGVPIVLLPAMQCL